jgi:signal transduction histidine kinase/ligand-binding sensor domain-containing protein/DNA-binding response OmpR family regulator
MKKLVFIFVSILYFALFTQAQQDRFYTPYQGLSNTSFNCLVQDREGFLWIATNGGLNRFDGYNFKVYRHVPRDTNSIDIDNVYSVFVDSKDNLWVGTARGLYIYNKMLDNFSRFPVKFNDKPIEIQVNTILEDKYENLWLGTDLGLVKTNPKSKTSYFFNRNITNNQSLNRDLINMAIFDENGCLWIASDKNGLFFYDPAKNEFINYKHNRNTNSICDNSILAIAKDHNGNIVAGSIKGGISILNPISGTFKNIPNSNNPDNPFSGGVYSILVDKSGTIWIGTERNGLKILDKETYTLRNANSLIDVSNVGDTKIHCYNDIQGNFWFAIDYEGLYFKKRSIKPFYSIQKKANSKIGLSNNIVKSILLDSQNNLWVGTDGGGLNYFPAKGGKNKVFTNNPENQSSLPDNAVISLYEDSSQNLWIGTYLGGLSLYNRNQEKFSTFLIDPLKKGRDYNYVHSIISDGLGNLWVATNGGGLKHFDCKTQTFKNYQTISVNEKKINLPLFITALLLDKEGNLWLASYNGLHCWNEKKFTYESFTISNGKLESDAIYSLLEDKNNNLWFGTSSGVYCYRKKDKNLTKYSTQDGLPNNSVFGMLEDNKGYLWLSTLNGLSKFDPQRKLFSNFYSYDGLPCNEFRPSSCFKAKNGTIYFGGTSGLVYFNPDSISTTSGFPTVTLSDFRIFNNIIPIGKMDDGRVILTKSVNESDEITINHADNNFTIEFAAIDYCGPEKIKYGYLMEGFDKKWIYKDFSQRYATYTNLNPGRYTFKLKTTNISGDWNDKYKTIIINIKPPYWKTKWAYLIYILLIIILFLIIRRLLIFRINMQNKLDVERLEREKLEELNQSKMQFFSNVSHEFRTPLTLILGPIERLANSRLDGSLKKQVEFIHKNTLRLLRLVNLLLDLQKVEKNEMHLRARLGDIVAFTEEITMSFEELSQQKKLTLTFVSKIKKLDIWFDSDKLDKVLFNLLSNAVKFTPKGGSITVELITENNSAYAWPLNKLVKISVSDTGKGIKEEQLHKIFERFYQIEGSESEMQLGTGIGLHLSKFLVELHHGKITVSSREGEGTQFNIFIPLEGDYLQDHQKIVEPSFSTEPNNINNVLQEINEAIEPEMVNADKKSKQKEKKISKRYKILVVEDDHEIRSYIKSELNDFYDVIEAFDGADGYEMAQSQMPDLIVSDVMMPRMDGIQLCKKIKSDLSTSHIPVILLTARTSIESRIEGLEMGADSYIPKPFNPKHLLVRVEKLIELRESLLRKFSKSINFEAKEMTLTSADERFLQKAINLVKDNISNSDLNIEDMGSELGMSRVHLYRKLKALTNQTPSEFVRTIRLKQAAYLLAQNKINISEVAYAVGFSSHQYFTNCFQNYFNMSPTEYSHKNQEGNKIIDLD